MSPEEYVKAAVKTESPINDNIFEKVKDPQKLRMLHAAMGMATESSEFLDILKKHFFYGKPLDMTHAKKEVGDILWYMAVFCDATGTDFEELMQMNIDKLRARYEGNFSQDKAINRKSSDI